MIELTEKNISEKSWVDVKGHLRCDDCGRALKFMHVAYALHCDKYVTNCAGCKSRYSLKVSHVDGSISFLKIDASCLYR